VNIHVALATQLKSRDPSIKATNIEETDALKQVADHAIIASEPSGDVVPPKERVAYDHQAWTRDIPNIYFTSSTNLTKLPLLPAASPYPSVSVCQRQSTTVPVAILKAVWPHLLLTVLPGTENLEPHEAAAWASQLTQRG
jgi:hypothetical protein